MTRRLLALAFAAAAAPSIASQQLGGHVAYTDQHGVVRADSGRYRATFDEAGARIAVPPIGAVEPELMLQFVGAFRDGRQLADARPRKPRLVDGRVDFERGVGDGDDLVERYLLHDDGFEQRFRIAARPAGSGDLRLVLQVRGDVTAAAFAAGHRAVTFRSDGVAAIRYGEAFVLDRGGHHQRIATRYDGHGRLELIVPASFLDEAVYPVTVDPAVGPVTNPGGPSYADTHPDVVFASVYGNGYFVVWQREFASNQIALRGQWFDREGNATSNTLAITGAGVATNPAAVINDGPRILIVYEANDRIEGLWLHAYTNVTESPIVISAPAAGERDRRPTIASNSGTTFQVAWDRTLAGATYPQQIVMRHWHRNVGPAPVVAGAEVVVEDVPAWSGYVRNARLPTLSGWDQQLPQHFDVLYRLVWERLYVNPTPGDFDVRTCSFRYRDSPALQTSQLLWEQLPTTAAGGIGTDEKLPAIGAIAHGGGAMTYCIAWEDSQDVKAQLHDQDGSNGGVFDVRVTPDYEGMPAVAAGKCEFTIAYGEVASPTSANVDVRAARVLVDGSVAITDKPIDIGSGAFQNHIRACSIDRTTTNVNSTFVVWSGRTGPAGSGIDDVHGRVFEPVDAIHTWYGSACSGPAGELPHIYSEFKALPGEYLQVRADDAPPLSVGVLVCGDQLVSLPLPGAPGCGAYVGTPFLLSWAQPVSAAGQAVQTIFVPCSIPVSTTLAFQWAFLTPGHNALGLITSDDMDVTWVQ